MDGPAPTNGVVYTYNLSLSNSPSPVNSHYSERCYKLTNNQPNREEQFLSALSQIYDMALEFASPAPDAAPKPMRYAQRYLYSFDLPFEQFLEHCGGFFASIASQNNGYAKKMNRPGTLTARQLAALWYAQQGVSPYSGESIRFKDRALDHIQTLSLGGNNVVTNVVFITKSENSSKHAARLEDYCHKRGLSYEHVRLQIDRIHQKLKRVA